MATDRFPLLQRADLLSRVPTPTNSFRTREDFLLRVAYKRCINKVFSRCYCSGAVQEDFFIVLSYQIHVRLAMSVRFRDMAL